MKKVLLAVLLAGVVGAGVFGVSGIAAPSVARAQGSEMSEEVHVNLLMRIIELLTQQLELLRARLGSGSDDTSKGEDDSDDVGLSELEAKIYTNETLVKIELNGNKDLFSTGADTRSEIIEEILSRYDELSEAEVDGMLTIETEDRASRDSDKDWADEEDDDEDDDGEEDEDDNDDDEDDDGEEDDDDDN